MSPRNGRGPAFQRNFSPRAWLLRHAQVMLASLGRLSRVPLATLMTAAVIGIAIALPAGLDTLVSNVRALSGAWEGSASLSLFLKHTVDEDAAAALAKRIGSWPEVGTTRVIGRQEALAEFRRQSGFGEALDLLGENPLPVVILLQPSLAASSPDAAAALAKRLGKLPEVDLAQLDLQWVRRLHAMTHAAERGIWVLAGLLSLAVLLIVGNTIRLEINNRRQEIEINKLVGATNAFIRRPFLYDGLWYGVLGGLIAWLLVTVSLGLLQGPVAQLAGLYDSQFDLAGLGLGNSLVLLGGGGLLGLLGAWLAVGRHLAAIEPA
jgi:cell division transport system permease protein